MNRIMNIPVVLILAISVAFSFPFQCAYAAAEDYAKSSSVPEQAVATSSYDAATNHKHVVDDANILSASAEGELSAKIEQMTVDYQQDIVIYTVNELPSNKTIDVYAADFYIANNYGIGSDRTGMICIINMGANRGWYTAATGRCESLISSETINYVDDAIEPAMKQHDFDAAMIEYLDKWDTIWENHGTIPETKLLDKAKDNIFYAIATGLLIAGLITLSKVKKNKTIEIATKANEYAIKNSLTITNHNDQYITTIVSRIPKPQANSHHGSSSFGGFSSSGGTHFSGGGRHF